MLKKYAQKPVVDGKRLILLFCCSQLMHGIVSEVNMCADGNCYLRSGRYLKDGVYIAKIRFGSPVASLGSSGTEDDHDPTDPVGNIESAQYLGTRKAARTTVAQQRNEISSSVYNAVVHMLEFSQDAD